MFGETSNTVTVIEAADSTEEFQDPEQGAGVFAFSGISGIVL
jgi:hypothetical protein